MLKTRIGLCPKSQKQEETKQESHQDDTKMPLDLEQEDAP